MNKITHNNVQESGVCECCGTISMSSYGRVANDVEEIFRYVVRWTKDDRNHPVGVFIISNNNGQVHGITVEYRLADNGFMIVDPDRFDWPTSLMGDGTHYLKREEILKANTQNWVYDSLDFIWANDNYVPKCT